MAFTLTISTPLEEKILRPQDCGDIFGYNTSFQVNNLKSL